MSLRIADHGWDGEIDRCLIEGGDSVRIASPFIKLGAVERFLAGRSSSSELVVVTRFDLDQFRPNPSGGGVDLDAFLGIEVRGVQS